MIIVLEGPDHSGKTTLAQALMGWIDESYYVKSPASKLTPWREEYNSWVQEQITQTPPSHAAILDRTPEIAEVVYGSIQPGREPRVRHPISEYHNWSERTVALVFCQFLAGIEDDRRHTDTFGKPVEAHKISLAYRVIQDLFLAERRLHVWNYRATYPNEWEKLTGWLYNRFGRVVPSMTNPAPQWNQALSKGATKWSTSRT